MKEKILIVKLGALGDLAMNFPYFAFVRSQYPKSHMTLLTRPIYVDFMKNCPWFDEIMSDGFPPSYNVFRILSVRRKIIRQKFTIIYDFQRGSRSRRYLFAVKAEVRHHPDIPADFSYDRKWLLQSDIGHFSLQKPYVVVVPGCAPHRAVKRWSDDNYGRFCASINEMGYLPVICGGDAEKSIAETILSHCPSACNLVSRTYLAEVSHVIAESQATVGNDTGLVHIANVLQKPTLVLLSCESPAVFQKHVPVHVKVLRSPDLADLSVDEVVAAFKTF